MLLGQVEPTKIDVDAWVGKLQRPEYEPIALSLREIGFPTVVELLGREGAQLRVRGIDMLDGTPILDIKPYLSNITEDKLRRGWLAEAEARRATPSSDR